VSIRTIEAATTNGNKTTKIAIAAAGDCWSCKAPSGKYFADYLEAARIALPLAVIF
jgi:hypothetical protein